MSKRNDVVDEMVTLLQAATTEHLAGLDDEADISRGPVALGAVDDLEMGEKKVWLEVAGDDMTPATLDRDGHSMAVYVLVAMRSYDREDDMPTCIDLADEVERAILSDRTLNGEVQEIHPMKFIPGYVTTDQDNFAIVQMQFIMDFHTTD